MSIQLLNSKAELASFPIQQSLRLAVPFSVESSSLEDSIFLFRLVSENPLVSLSEPYSYTLGYVKETFDLLPMNFTVEENNGQSTITCVPLKPLNVTSRYCLYVSKNLSERFINVNKIVSKSTSGISVKTLKWLDNSYSSTLKVKETSKLIDGKNIVKFSVDGQEVTLDVRVANTIDTQEFRIFLQDSIYIKDEEFSIEIGLRSNLVEDFQYVFETVDSKTITPLPLNEASTSISNADILNFYQNLNNQKKETVVNKSPTYVGVNSFYIELPEGYVLDRNTDIITKLGVAFNNYILKDIGLYKEGIKYILEVEEDTFDNVIIFTLNENPSQDESEPQLKIEVT